MVLLAGCYTSPSQEEMIAASSERLHLGLKAKPSEFVLPGTITDPSCLSADDVVVIALWNNPELQEALAGVGVERGKMLTAAHIANPRLSFMLPLGQRQFEFLAVHPVLDVWLLRPHRIEWATKNAAHYARTLEEQCLDVMLRIRLLCAKLSYNMAMHENLLQEKTVLERLIAFHRASFQSGQTSGLNVTQLELELALLDAAIQREALDHKNVKHDLDQLMGASEHPWEWTLSEDTAEMPVVTLSKDALLKTALLSRPAVRATEIQAEMAAQKHSIAVNDVWNFLIGISDKELGESKASGWTLSIGLDVPIFNQNEGGKATAKAELEKVLRTYEAQRNAIAHDIAAALQGMENCRAQMDHFETVVVPAAVQYRQRVETLIQNGRENQEALLLAERQIEKVQAVRAQSVYQHRCAYHQLERAVASSLATASQQERTERSSKGEE